MRSYSQGRRETDQPGELPPAGNRSQLKRCAAGVGAARTVSSICRSAVYIAGAVQCNACGWIPAVVAAGELVHKAFFPEASGSWRQLIDQATAASRGAYRSLLAVLARAAVKIARGIEGQIALRSGSAGPVKFKYLSESPSARSGR